MLARASARSDIRIMGLPSLMEKPRHDPLAEQPGTTSKP
jgi:hypothetical protein